MGFYGNITNTVKTNLIDLSLKVNVLATAL